MLAFCSTSRMVTPRSRLMRTMISKMSFTSLGDRPSEGSSSSISLRPRHQRPADRQHLLLAARQRAGALLGALLQHREVPEHRLEVLRHAVGVAARVGAHAQVLAHRSGTERPRGPPARG